MPELGGIVIILERLPDSFKFFDFLFSKRGIAGEFERGRHEFINNIGIIKMIIFMTLPGS